MSGTVPLTGSLMSVMALSTLLLCAGCEDKRGVRIGDDPPAISGRDIRGNSVTLARLKGKIVVVYFWTNSCCGGSVAELEPMYRRNKHKGLAVLAINEIDQEKEVQSFAEKNGLTFTILADEHSRILRKYQVFAFPTVFILDWNGVVRERILGNVGSVQLEKLILRQVDAKKKTEESYEKSRVR